MSCPVIRMHLPSTGSKDTLVGVGVPKLHRTAQHSTQHMQKVQALVMCCLDSSIATAHSLFQCAHNAVQQLQQTCRTMLCSEEPPLRTCSVIKQPLNSFAEVLQMPPTCLREHHSAASALPGWPGPGPYTSSAQLLQAATSTVHSFWSGHWAPPGIGVLVVSRWGSFASGPRQSASPGRAVCGQPVGVRPPKNPKKKHPRDIPYASAQLVPPAVC